MLSNKPEDVSMSGIPSSHKRQHEYAFRLPTPPRIVVPPPSLTYEMPSLHLGLASTSNEDVDIGFLKELHLEDTVQKNTLLEWAYERRRQAQMILPWLYLGPMTAAKDKDFLKREGITMILAIRARENSMMGAIKNAQEVCHEVATIEAANYYQLVSQFFRTTNMINQHMARYRQVTAANGDAQLGKVLVFCESGNEKSAAVVAAYLMNVLDNFNHICAMQVCQAQRFCVNFDDSIKNILRSHWDIIQAKRAVATSHAEARATTLLFQNQNQNQNQNLSVAKPKRTIEDFDDDVDMDGFAESSDKLRFTGRDVTPFQDR
ncbi:phosphatases II [Amniculicola lignicola CBS 123094]|uniref:Phosphatases II n=1 Tax=Amniculicola lignicola CBS 123094 TaxID=1392246 RepID=A0A6A5WUG7_9PLEO|nr:phosphatases II [Amniculicola lignicola CBS 123094]